MYLKRHNRARCSSYMQTSRKYHVVYDLSNGTITNEWPWVTFKWLEVSLVVKIMDRPTQEPTDKMPRQNVKYECVWPTKYTRVE